MATDAVIGYRAYAKNGNDKELNLMHVRMSGDATWAGAVTLAMLANQIPGNKDLFKTTIDFALHNNVETIGQLGPTNKYNSNDLNDAPIISDIGIFNTEGIENSSYRLGVENDDIYALTGDFDYVYVMDYTAGFGKGVLTTILKDDENPEEAPFGIEHPIGYDGLSLELALMIRNTLLKRDGVENPEMTEQKFKNMFHKYAHLANNVNALGEALTDTDWVPNDGNVLSYPQVRNFTDEKTLEFLKDNVDLDKMKEMKIIDIINQIINDGITSSEELTTVNITNNGEIILTPLTKSQKDLISEKYADQLKEVGFAGLATKICDIQDAQIIPSSINNDYENLLKMNFLNDFNFGSFYNTEISQSRAEYIQNNNDNGELHLSKEEGKYLRDYLFSHKSDGYEVIQDVVGAIASGETTATPLYEAKTTHEGTKHLTAEQLLSYTGGFDAVMINDSELHVGSEWATLYTAGGIEIAAYKDEPQDRTALLEAIKNASDIKLYGTHNGRGGTTLNKDAEKISELETLVQKYKNYDEKINTEISGDQILDDIATDNQLILAQVGAEIKILCDDLGGNHLIDNTTIESFDKSIISRDQNGLDGFISRAKSDGKAALYEIETNIGTFTIAHTEQKLGKYETQIQSRVYKLAPNSPENESRLCSLAEITVQKLVDKHGNYESGHGTKSREYMDESTLSSIMKNELNLKQAKWEDVISPDLQLDYKNAGGGVYINYKGANMEHYNDEDNQIHSGIQLYKACKHVEDIGFVPGDFGGFKIQEAMSYTKDMPHLHNIAKSNDISERLSGDALMIDTPKGPIIFNKEGKGELFTKEVSDYHTRTPLGFTTANLGQDKPHLGSCYGKAQGIIDKLNEYNVPQDIFDGWGSLNPNNFDKENFASPSDVSQFELKYQPTKEEKPYFEDKHSKIISGYSDMQEIWGNNASNTADAKLDEYLDKDKKMSLNLKD